MKYGLVMLLIFLVSLTGCAGKEPRVSLSREEREKMIYEEMEKKLVTGVGYIKAGRLEYAEVMFLKILSKDPDQPGARNNLGVIYKRKGMLEEAIEEYREAIKLEPEYYEAHNNLGIAYKDVGKFEKARQEYQTALSINPGFSDSWYNLAILYDLYLGRPDLAVESFNRYIEIAGNDPVVDKWIEEIKSR